MTYIRIDFKTLFVNLSLTWTINCFTVSSKTSTLFYTSYFLQNALTAAVLLGWEDINFISPVRLSWTNRILFSDWTDFNFIVYLTLSSFSQYVCDIRCIIKWPIVSSEAYNPTEAHSCLNRANEFRCSLHIMVKTLPAIQKVECAWYVWDGFMFVREHWIKKPL